MNKIEAIAVLKKHEAELRKRGVRHAALFGSLARDEANAGSDVDVLIEVNEDNISDIFAYVGLVSYIRGLFPQKVDVANKACLKSHVRPSAEREAIHAF